jgi:hypothetical protein
MATDVTRGRLLRLPWDYELLEFDPDGRGRPPPALLGLEALPARLPGRVASRRVNW